MREVLDDWPTMAPPGENRIQSWRNIVVGVISVIWIFLIAVAAKCYLIALYLWSYVWPWSSRYKNLQTRKRKENEFRQLVLQTSHNTVLVVPRQVPDQDCIKKKENILFQRIPFEIRRQILVLAFGEQTVHMDLQFRYPLDLAEKKLTWLRLHARIDYSRSRRGTDGYLQRTEGERQEWRWFSCVCHRFPPNATQLSHGRRRNYPWLFFRDPDDDRCLEGCGTCEEWPGEWPVKCQIGIMGWLLSCKQA